MSSPKKKAKKQKLERDRQRKIEAKHKRDAKRGRAASVAPRFSVPGFDDAPPEGVKMSEVLLDFIDPYVDLADDGNEAYRRLLTLAIVAWNVALEPEPRRTEMLDKVFSLASRNEPEEVRLQIRQFVSELVKRKLALFGHIRRPILDFVLEDRGGGKAHLSVISALA